MAERDLAAIASLAENRSTHRSPAELACDTLFQGNVAFVVTTLSYGPRTN
jgi:hypothetical protein